MNDLFEEMKYAYEMFCLTAQQFMDAAKEQNTSKAETSDYKSWIGKVVYVWDDDFDEKRKAVLLDYDRLSMFPFRTAGGGFEHAELCKEQTAQV